MLQEGSMEVGVVGPPGAPVFKARSQGVANATTPLPVQAERPVLER